MEVTTIGGATVDIIVSGSNSRSGESAKQDVDHIDMYMGGGAVIAGLGFLACGARVNVVAAVGKDAEGTWFRGLLARNRLGLEGLQTIAGKPTGKAVVHLDGDAEALVFAQRGASMELAVPSVPARLLAVDLVYVSALADVAVKQLVEALKMAHRGTRRLVLNPGARQLAASAASLEALLDMADLVCVNAQEAHLLAQAPFNAHAAELARDELRTLFARIRQRTSACVLITMGAKGAVFFNGEETYHCPALPTPVVSTLGAGDAYASTFAFHWASGRGACDALSAATRQAANVLGVVAANLAGPLTSGIAS